MTGTVSVICQEWLLPSLSDYGALIHWMNEVPPLRSVSCCPEEYLQWKAPDCSWGWGTPKRPPSSFWPVPAFLPEYTQLQVRPAQLWQGAVYPGPSNLHDCQGLYSVSAPEALDWEGVPKPTRPSPHQHLTSWHVSCVITNLWTFRDTGLSPTSTHPCLSFWTCWGPAP